MNGGSAIPVNQVINLAAGEKLFLFVTNNNIGNGCNMLVYNGTSLILSMVTKPVETQHYGMRPFKVFEQLVKKMAPTATAVSTYFNSAEGSRVCIFPEHSFTNPSEAANIVTSFSDFFKFYNSLRPMGLRIEGNNVHMEPLEVLYTSAPVIMDFGEVKNLNISYASEMVYNEVKIGYPAADASTLGNPGYSGRNSYRIEGNTNKNILELFPNYITTPSIIESRRVAPSTKPAPPSDSTQIYACAVENTDDGFGFYYLYRVPYTTQTGLVPVAAGAHYPLGTLDAYNLEYLTPSRMMRAQGTVLRPLIEQLPALTPFKFSSCDRVGDLITGTINEQADLTIGDFNGVQVWHAFTVAFEAVTPYRFAEIFDAFNGGVVGMLYLGQVIYLVPIGTMKSYPASDKPAEYKFMISTLTPISTLLILAQGGFAP